MSNERTLKIGRKAELEELIQGLRIEVDVMVSALRDKIGFRDADLSYTEKLDIKSMKVYMKEIERKHGQLSKHVRDLAIINAELMGSEN
ncbi:MAG: hypothetical protein Q8L88_02275 [Bacteroidota bacterium]|nr:hypothetical protein [Bacteroidota bacterium]